jgi:PAS domain S-box-containing protein
MINTDHNGHTLDPETYLKTIKVLLVSEANDDYIRVKAMLNDTANSSHYSLIWSNSYAESINAMLKRHYDLYLVDYRLGKYTGINLLHEAICSNCTEPIIMLSTLSDIKADGEALRIGAMDYLVKENLDGYTLERSMRYALEHNITLINLKGSENKFRAIFERSKYPIIISDYSGKLYDANPAAVKFFDLPLEKLLAVNDTQFYANLNEREQFIEGMEDRGSVNDLEVTLALPNGQSKYCSISSFVQVSQHGTTILYHSIINDLTARKEHESALTRKIAVSEYVAKNLVSDIQSPLSNVNQALNDLTITLNGKGDSVKKYLDIVKENCDRIEQLTKKLTQSTVQP